MILFILTKDGYEQMQLFIQKFSPVVWINKNTMNEDELVQLRASGLEITNFTFFIDPSNKEQIQSALDMIKEHHPGQIIWVEL